MTNTGVKGGRAAGGGATREILTGTATAKARYASNELFPTGLSEIRIEHKGAEYILRITKQDKLILNK